jgi:hypothetical protein
MPDRRGLLALGAGEQARVALFQRTQMQQLRQRHGVDRNSNLALNDAFVEDARQLHF